MDSRERLTRLRDFLIKQFNKDVDEENHASCNDCEEAFKPVIINYTTDCPKCGGMNSVFY